MNRRDLLAIPAAATAAGFVPGALQAVTWQGATTEIVALYREIERIDGEAAKYESGLLGQAEDDELDRLFYNRRDHLIDVMMELPCTCAADFAAKVVLETVKGQAYSDWETGPLWIEARRLVGIR